MRMIKRFTILQRIFHGLLILTFTSQAASGLARLYIENSFGQFLASIFGGYESAGYIHRYVGIFMILLFLVHVVYVLIVVMKKGIQQTMLGPDSILPRPKDLSQYLRHTAWMFGLSKEPGFDRWTYWEKFDYWAVFWGMIIIGSTGLILFNPLITSKYMPGWGLNIAMWIHRIEALLAIGHVFIIHFFIAHVRRHNFPMDLAMFEGGLSEDKVSEERSLWYERLRAAEGLTESALVSRAGVVNRIIYYAIGFIIMFSCVYLLVGAIRYARLVTW